MDLKQRQTLILAILALFLGRWVNRHAGPLRYWNIPERPSIDGLVALLPLGPAWILGIGTHLNALCAGVGLRLPQFVTALFASIVLANTVRHVFPKVPWSTGTAPLALVADLALGMFLAMSLMSLQLWTLLDVAEPLRVILAAQAVIGWA